MYRLENSTEYMRQSGRRIRRWHKFVKGWCSALGRLVTFCVGVVKDRLLIDLIAGEGYHEAQAMFSAWIKKIGLKRALYTLSLPGWWN
jgi:hypothetical protein